MTEPQKHKVYKVDKQLSIYGFSGIYVGIAAGVIVLTFLVAMIMFMIEVSFTTMLIVCSILVTSGLFLTHYLSTHFEKNLSKQFIRYKRYLK